MSVRPRQIRWGAAATCVVLQTLLLACCPGQMPVTEGSTIHVYTNLLQIPVLILDRKHEPMPAISPAQFTVQFGKEVPFKPLLVRQQGEDPITLAILLDGSSRDALLPLSENGLAAMAGEQLSPRDRVAVYALDGCKLRRLAALGPASAYAMRDSVARAAATPPYEGWKHGAEPCPRPVGLWDATEYLVRSLAAEPGRRVVLAVTNGHDLGSQMTPDGVRKSANQHGVTVFAVAERYKVPLLGPVFPRTTAGWQVTSFLSEVTEGSGGMILESTRNNLPYTFKHFVQLLRARYIVEFQRPSGLVAGTSILTVSCGQKRAFVRPAGTSLPIADPVARDESVEHGKPAQNPVSSEVREPPAP